MFEIQKGELTGFGLGGYRAKNGVIKIEGSDRHITDWPEEITFHGNTYTLETVEQGGIDQKSGAIWENAEYV